MPTPISDLNKAAATPGSAEQLSQGAGATGGGPSSFYRSSFWRAGHWTARHTPRGCVSLLMRGLCQIYAHLHPSRRKVVANNLLPILQGNQAAANRTALQLFRQFGGKLADLWSFESGTPIQGLFHELLGWDHLQAALAQGRGVLLVTLHLGNWEFGAPLLTERGIRLQVITLPEPEDALTELRQSARARWGIETLALSEDHFAPLQIMRRLHENSCVALLMDRPPAPTAVHVQLFGRPFPASVSAAELARATGCAIVPVYLPKTARGYVAHILPAVAYDQPALRQPAARQALTQQIMDAFQPALRHYPDQWYHFVPVWPES